MKKKILLVVPFAAMLLAGCSGSGSFIDNTDLYYFDSTTAECVVNNENSFLPTQAVVTTGCSIEADFEENGIESINIPVERKLIAINVTNKVSKYELNDVLVRPNVKAYYDNGTIREVYGYTLSGYNMKASGTQTVLVTYTEGDITKTATYDILVGHQVLGIAVTPNVVDLYVGQTAQLDAHVLPEGSYGVEITWTSDDFCVTVDDDGVVKATKAGQAIVTASINDGKYTASCVVNVLPLVDTIPLVTTDGFVLADDIKDGDFVYIAGAYTNYGQETAMFTIPYYSSGNNIKAVSGEVQNNELKVHSSTGMFMVVEKDGLYAFLDENGRYLSATGGSKNNYMKTSTKLDDTCLFDVTFNGEYADIVCPKVDRGHMRFNYNSGTPLVSCYASTTSVSQFINIYKGIHVHVNVENITITNTISIKAGMSKALEISVAPLFASHSPLSYEIEDTSIASVDENGVITGIKGGTTKVTVRSVENPSIFDSAEVTVVSELLAKFDLTNISDILGSGTSAIGDKEKITNAINERSSDKSRKISVTDVAQLYGGYSGNTEKGLKFGTSSKEGKITFTFTLNVERVVLECYGWSATDSFSINGSEKQIPGVAYSKEGSLKVLTFDLSTPSDTITINISKRGFIKSISLCQILD